MLGHSSRLRTPEQFDGLTPERQGVWFEWLVSQELWRRAARRGDELPEEQVFWATRRRELDFMVGDDAFVEVKPGRAGPLDFAWFPRELPGASLTVLTSTPFETRHVRGVTLEDWLQEGEG